MPERLPSASRVRLALVLSAGGLRGAAHVGVLRALVRLGVPIDAIVGVSAGAVIGAYYAAVGLRIDELVGDAAAFRGRHLLAYSLNVQLGYRWERRLRSACGVIPERLHQLESATFDDLRHGVQRLGIVCHDRVGRRPRYFSTGFAQGVRLSDAVRASASIPALFPAIDVRWNGESLRLTDGGISDPVPIAFARSARIGATHLIVSDCRWIGRCPDSDDRTIWIRPKMPSVGTLWSPASSLLTAVRDGEAAVAGEHVDRIQGWLADTAVFDAAV